MAELKFPDFAGEDGATLAGTVITLAGSAVTNHRTFANAASDSNIDFDDGDTIAVDIIDTSGNTATWTATYASGAGTLTRTNLEAAQGTLSTSAGAITAYASVPGSWFAVRESGTAFPVAADYPGGSIPDGAMFYHQTRKVLYGYEQGWVAREALDDVTVYVDGDSGTDGDDYGYGTGANAFATIAGMLARIPRTLLGNTLTISFAAKTGNYSEGALAWKLPVDGKIVITGTGEVTEGTATAISAITQNHYVTNNDAREWGCKLAVSGTPSGWASGKRFYRVTSGTYSGQYGALMESGTDYVKTATRTENVRVKADTSLPLEVVYAGGDLVVTDQIAPMTLGVIIDGEQTFSGHNINIQFIKFLARVTVDVGASTHFLCCEFDSTGDALIWQIKLLADAYLGACYVIADHTSSQGMIYVEGGASCLIMSSYFESEAAGYVVNTTTPCAMTAYASRFTRTDTTGANDTLQIKGNATFTFGSAADQGSTIVNLSTNSSAYAVAASLAGIILSGQDSDNAAYGAGNSGTNDHDPTTSTGFALIGA